MKSSSNPSFNEFLGGVIPNDPELRAEYIQQARELVGAYYRTYLTDGVEKPNSVSYDIVNDIRELIRMAESIDVKTTKSKLFAVDEKKKKK